MALTPIPAAGTLADILTKVGNLNNDNVLAFNALRAYVDAQDTAIRALIPTGAGSGDMLKANNLSDLVNIIQARTNLGLGSVATHALTELLQAANNLSDLASPSAARTALGLGALATLSTITASLISDPTNVKSLESLEVAFSDEATNLVTGTGVVSFFVPYAFTLTEVFTGLGGVSTSGAVTTDLKNGAGTTVFTTKPTIGANQRTSLSGSGSVAAALSITSLAKGEYMTIDINAAGTNAKGGKMLLIGKRT